MYGNGVPFSSPGNGIFRADSFRAVSGNRGRPRSLHRHVAHIVERHFAVFDFSADDSKPIARGVMRSPELFFCRSTRFAPLSVIGTPKSFRALNAAPDPFRAFGRAGKRDGECTSGFRSEMATDRLVSYDIFAIFMAARKNVPGFRAGRKVSIAARRSAPFGCRERYESFRANR